MTKKIADIIDVSLCPSCQRLTTMERITKDNYFCRVCHQRFKQFQNGKLIYIPLAVADAIERTKEQLKFEFEADPQLDLFEDMNVSFTPEDDLDKN